MAAGSSAGHKAVTRTSPWMRHPCVLGIFPSDSAIIRLVGVLLLEQR